MIFSKEKPKNCRGCKHRDKCGGEKKKCVYRLKALEASLEASFPCKTCAYGKHHEMGKKDKFQSCDEIESNRRFEVDGKV